MCSLLRHLVYPWWRFCKLFICSIYFLGIYLVPTAWCQPPEDSLDPIPLRRVPLRVERLPEEMEKVNQGILVEMPRRIFEGKVRQASKSKNAQKNDPQLVEARYRGRLEDSALAGTGQWKILYSGARPSVLPLESLNLAIRQPRFENREALVGDFEGVGLGLLVEEPGTRSVSLDWTARGEQSPAGLRFKLETPPCPVAALEVDVPADQVVNEEVGDCQVSGPYPSDSPNRRLWRISFADRPKLYLTIRKLDGPGQSAPLILVDQLTEQRISPDTVLSDFRFNLTVHHQGLRNLQFNCDPSLTPYKVVAPKMEKWDLHPGPTPNAPNLLTIYLREPLRDGSIKVYCRSPIGNPSEIQGTQAQGSLWKSPFIHLAGGIPIGETLKLFLHPDIVFEDWQANSFTLSESKSETTQDRNWPHVLTLKGTESFDNGKDKNSKPEKQLRPLAWIPRQKAEFAARTVMWWQEPFGRSELLIQVDYEVVKGKLFRLPLVLPAGWEVDRVKTDPPALLRDWTIRSENGRKVMEATLQRSLTGEVVSANSPLLVQNAARLTVSMRRVESPSSRSQFHKGRAIPFPEVVVPEARRQSGGLAIDWDEQTKQGRIATGAATISPPKDGPWGSTSPKAYFLFGEKGLPGTLDLESIPAKFAARSSSKVALKGGRVSVEGTINLSVESGSLNELLVCASIPMFGLKFKAMPEKSKEDISFEPLNYRRFAPYIALLGIAQPVAASINLTANSQEHWGRLKLPRPLLSHDHISLRYFSVINQPSSPGQWDIPLLWLPGATSNECTIAVQNPPGNPLEFKTRGLTEIDPSKVLPKPSGPPFPWRAFGYITSDVNLSILRHVPVEPQPVKQPVFFASLISSVDPDSISQRFQFSVKHWKQSTLPIQFPLGIKITSVRIDGIRLDRLARNGGDGDSLTTLVNLPVPTGLSDDSENQDSQHDYEICYTEPNNSGTFWGLVEIKQPILPQMPIGFRHSWLFPDGLAPVYEGRLLEQSPPSQFLLEKMKSQGKRLWTNLSTFVHPNYQSQNVSWHSFDSTEDPRFEDESEWTEWKMASPMEGPSHFLIVQKAKVSVGGLLVAGLGTTIAWLVRKASSRFQLAILLMWLAGFGIAFIWTPLSLQSLAGWPLLAGLICGLFGYVYVVCRSHLLFAKPNSHHVKAVSAAIVMSCLGLFGLTSISASSNEPVDNTVFLVPGPKDNPDRSLVLVSPGLLKKLETLATRQEAKPRSCLILSASYEGKIVNQGVEFQAEWLIHSFEESPAWLHVPLLGVQIQDDVLLDGARTLPVVEPAPKNGLSLKVEGLGAHIVRMRFRVPIQGTEDHNAVEFTGPRPPQSRMLVHLPAGADFPQTPTRLGIQRITTNADGNQVEADLGTASAPIVLRWHQPKDVNKPPTVQAREAYLWVLRPSTSSLTARVELKVNAGIVTRAEINLPEPLEVRSVSLEVNDRPSGVLAPHIKQWKVERGDHQRTLTIDFQYPIQGMVQLLIELVPRSGFRADASLPIPVINDVQSTLSISAYRLEGVEGHVKGVAHLTGMKARDFVDAWKSLGGEDFLMSAGAYSISRASDSNPALQIDIQSPSPALDVFQEITWRNSSIRQDFVAKQRLRSGTGDLVLAEWHVPETVVVSRVAGRHVWHWSHRGSCLQIWLHQAGSIAELEFAGWLIQKNDALPKSIAGNADPVINHRLVSLDLPSIYSLSTRTQSSTIRVVPQPGFDVIAPEAANLIPLPRIGSKNQDKLYLASRADYGTRIQLRPTKTQVNVNQFVFVEIRDRQLRIVCDFKLSTPLRVDGGLELNLRDGAKFDVHLEGSTLLRFQERRSGSGDRLWNLELQPNATGNHRVFLTATIPLDALQDGISVPQAKIVSEGASEEWIVLAERDLVAVDHQGLNRIQVNGSGDQAWKKSWAEKADLIRQGDGELWKVEKDAWKLLVSPMDEANGTRTSKAFLTSHTLAVAESGQWTHEAVYWLLNEGKRELEIMMPPGASLSRIALDNVDATSFEESNQRILLPLSEGPRVTQIRFSWKYAEGAETIQRPRLELPTLADTVDGPTLWTVEIPLDMEVFELPKNKVDRALMALQRTVSLLQLATALAEAPSFEADAQPQRYMAIQEQFYEACRVVGDEIDQHDSKSGAVNRSSRDLHIRLQALLEQNKQIASKLGLEQVRAEMEKRVREGKTLTVETGNLSDSTFVGLGKPLFMIADNAKAVPVIRLRSASQTQANQAWISTLIVGVLVIGIWLVSLFPRLVGAITRFWPEQLVLLACLGYLAFGNQAVFMGLLLIGSAIRLFLIARRCLGWARGTTLTKSVELTATPMA
jgi:hypothetical protein